MSAVLGASVDANQTLVEVADPLALDIVFQRVAGRSEPHPQWRHGHRHQR